ncbi:MAG: hypothetical protein QGG48_07065 [Desulfatiglandales bacterium]|nr:hypothetical protein [Desulfatiglandales bacterium]
MLEGGLPEIHDPNSVMLEGMVEMYTPKFIKFLAKKDFISLPFKKSMSQTEFMNFIDYMSDLIFDGTHAKSDKERFSLTLNKRDIFGITYIFNGEFLAIIRKILCRFQLVLARLQKNFRMVPLYMDLDADKRMFRLGDPRLQAQRK